MAQVDLLYAVKTILRDVKLHRMALERIADVHV
jgi:hypothetical protein